MAKAEYLIIQQVDDPLRREGVNVGVVVRVGSDVAARFVGETVGGAFEPAAVAGMVAPGVYRQWVRYWRRAMGRADPFAEIVGGTHTNYWAIPSGEVRDVGGDTARDAADVMYGRLVTERRFAAPSKPPAGHVLTGWTPAWKVEGLPDFPADGMLPIYTDLPSLQKSVNVRVSIEVLGPSEEYERTDFPLAPATKGGRRDA